MAFSSSKSIADIKQTADELNNSKIRLIDVTAVFNAFKFYTLVASATVGVINIVGYELLAIGAISIFQLVLITTCTSAILLFALYYLNKSKLVDETLFRIRTTA